MDAHTLSSLQYDEIVDLLKGYAASELGRRECEGICPTSNPEEAKRLLAEVTALRGVLDQGVELPLEGVVDIGPILQRARVEGAILTSEELLAIAASIRISSALKRIFCQLSDRFSPLVAIGRAFTAPLPLAHRIEGAITPAGGIADRASPLLWEIRGRIKEVREAIQRRLEELVRSRDLQDAIQDEVITQRNGRSVLLIRSDAKGRVKGIVHDYSQSRASLYLEPLEVVEYNNELQVLAREERLEEERILKGLTTEVRERVDWLVQDLALQGRVDAIYAKARFSIAIGGAEPMLNTEGRVRLLAARHPLLAHAAVKGEREVVPIDLLLDPGQRILVISGANTGGKTVALKTLGLLTLMAQAGLHIPADKDSEVYVFQQIFASIGDEQDLQGHLSTFSSFIVWLNRILDRVDARSLVLIDEIGVGTEYAQGAALAMGLLDYIRERGGYAAVTSHANPLKTYAASHDGVVNVAVGFDEEGLRPTYQLIYGVPGTSLTLQVAQRLGLRGEVLERARCYQSEVQRDLEGLMEELVRLHHRLQREREDARCLREEALRQRERLARAAEQIKERKAKIFAQVEAQGREMIRSLEQRLKEVLRQAQQGEGKPAALKGEVKRIGGEFTAHFPRAQRQCGGGDIRVGDRVEVFNLAKEGVVLDIADPQRVEVSIGDIRVKTTLEGLRLVSRGKVAQQEGSDRGFPFIREGGGEDPLRELNVVGLRVADALPKVDKFLDDALLRDYEQVQIIHGIGSGRLREAIQEHLKGHRWVKGFRVGGPEEGGGGITIVQLR